MGPPFLSHSLEENKKDPNYTHQPHLPAPLHHDCAFLIRGKFASFDCFLDLALCPFQPKTVLIYIEYMRLVITTKC